MSRETPEVVGKFNAHINQLLERFQRPMIDNYASKTFSDRTTGTLLPRDNAADQKEKNENDGDPKEPAYLSYAWMLEEHPRFRISPYQHRWPNETLPQWAQKPSRMGQSTIPKNKHICFAHVGKCAGSTVGCGLGFSLHCGGSQPRKGLLPLYTTNIIHNGVNDCPDHMPYYLFTLRNPIERVKSTYVYDRPISANDKYHLKNGQAELYSECPFWTLQELAINGLAHDGTASADCKIRASRAIRGLERHGYHLWFNFQWYVETTQLFGPLSTARLLALRTEHLEADWNSVETLLHGDATSQNSTFVEKFDHSNASSRNSTGGDAELSEDALEVLCYYLCEEIQLYKHLLLNADNLKTSDFNESMIELQRTCPAQAKSRSCPIVET